MGEARQRFKETAEALSTAVETGVMEHHGSYVDQPRAELRPGPTESFAGRISSATISPEPAEIMARLGIGALIVPQKPWSQVRDETATYRRTYREAIGAEPPAPIVGVFRYGGMSVADGEANMRLFGHEVLPELQKVPPARERLDLAS